VLFLTEYVESLEKEITELKSKNRTLRQQIDDMSQSAKPPRRSHRETAPSHGGIQPQDPFIQAHIKELNGTIGKNPVHHLLLPKCQAPYTYNLKGALLLYNR